jgi:hypothetical protein
MVPCCVVRAAAAAPAAEAGRARTARVKASGYY